MALNLTTEKASNTQPNTNTEHPYHPGYAYVLSTGWRVETLQKRGRDWRGVQQFNVFSVHMCAALVLVLNPFSSAAIRL